ncbi:MAG: hypothetical protein HZB51_18235 [Chloroflexi bacterium]|nr:hypothetical protein [Chloroflexota bacterium]
MKQFADNALSIHSADSVAGSPSASNVANHWEHERKADVVRKVVGDFSGWDSDATKYEKAFNKLLKGLQAA